MAPAAHPHGNLPAPASPSARVGASSLPPRVPHADLHVSPPPQAGMASLRDLGLAEPEDDSRAALLFVGGESTALARVEHYLWRTDRIATYLQTRNGMLGPDYSSKFSPWLSVRARPPANVQRTHVRASCSWEGGGYSVPAPTWAR